MRTTTQTVYCAFDGTLFKTEAECRAYEKANAHLAIVGLTKDEALAIANREDPDRAAAVEYLAYQIAKARLEAGDRKRSKPQKRAPEPATEQAPAPAERLEIPVTATGQPFPGNTGEAA